MLHVRNISYIKYIKCCPAKMLHYSTAHFEIFNNKLYVLKVARMCEFLALSKCPERRIEGGHRTITSLARVSFLLSVPGSPSFSWQQSDLWSRRARRPTAVNDQKIRAIVEEESLPTIARSIGVNGYLTTRRPTFSPGHCVLSLLQSRP